ncbi:MAG: hypothetical protein JW750_07480 [Anaerolineaceae bacterium]|nr:hypothetical protein [Anaerolineaceae bacterium]
MNGSVTNLRYNWHALRRDQFWLPLAFLGLFMLLVALFFEESRAYNVAVAFLCVVLPLLSGFLAAYAVLEDPALELQFTTARSARSHLRQRMAIIFGVTAAIAVFFQLFTWAIGVSLSDLGNPLGRQVAWLLPTLSLMSLGNLFSLLLRRSTGGALLVGMLWIMQVILRGFFADHRWLYAGFLFLRGFYPDHSGVWINGITLSLITLLSLITGILMLKQQERYL